jgi:hypothetical protein
MAPGQKLYPRATVKKIVKAHSGCNMSKNVDVMVNIGLPGRVNRRVFSQTTAPGLS